MTAIQDPIMGEGPLLITEDLKELILESTESLVASPQYDLQVSLVHHWMGSTHKLIRMIFNYGWKKNVRPFSTLTHDFKVFTLNPPLIGYQLYKNSPAEKLGESFLRHSGPEQGEVKLDWENIDVGTPTVLGLSVLNYIQLRERSTGEQVASSPDTLSVFELLYGVPVDDAIGATASWTDNTGDSIFGTFLWEVRMTVDVVIDNSSSAGKKFALFCHLDPLETNDVGKWHIQDDYRWCNDSTQHMEVDLHSEYIELKGRDAHAQPTSLSKIGIWKLGFAIYDPADVVDGEISFSDFIAFSGVLLSPNHPNADNPSACDPPPPPP